MLVVNLFWSDVHISEEMDDSPPTSLEKIYKSKYFHLLELIIITTLMLPIINLINKINIYKYSKSRNY